MSKKTTYIHAENNNKILSSNEVRLYVPPEPKKMKIIIWGKELCNVAEWNDFLKCVEEKTKENEQLKQQLAEKDKEIESLKQELEETNAGYDFTYEQSSEAIKELKQNQTQLAIQELEKVKMMTEWKFNSVVDVVEYIDNQIKELKGE